MDSHFAQSISRLGPFEPNPILAVAVSGGADSLALVLLAHHWVKQQGGRVVALTVEHGLRQESEQEAKQVQQWLKVYAIEHHILHWNHSDIEGNIQAKARAARYALLTEWCKEYDVLHLLLGHHQDDQAETVLLRLQRGSGIQGVSAMAPYTEKNGIRLLRPLLGCTKKELQTYLSKKSQSWIEDPSNQKEDYTRTVIRTWLGAYPGEGQSLFTSRLADFSHHAMRVRDMMEGDLANAMVRCISISSLGVVLLKRVEWLSLHEEYALRILARICTMVSGHVYPPRYDVLVRLYTRLKEEEDIKTTCYGTRIVTLSGGDVVRISREAGVIRDVQPLDRHKICCWDNRFLLSLTCFVEKPLIVKEISPNEWVRLKQDYPELQSYQSNYEVLLALPAIWQDNRVVAIPSILFYPENKVLNHAIACTFQPRVGLTQTVGLPCSQHSIGSVSC